MYRTDIPQEVGNGGQVCGDVEAIGFPVQNIYKMTYGYENATFEFYYVYRVKLNHILSTVFCPSSSVLFSSVVNTEQLVDFYFEV
jgi:hypothetical protein